MFHPNLSKIQAILPNPPIINMKMKVIKMDIPVAINSIIKFFFIFLDPSLKIVINKKMPK
jgi:hypothetical protein